MFPSEADIHQAIARRLAGWMKRRGETPASVAKGLQGHGLKVTEAAVRKWLRTGRLLEQNLLALATLLDVPPWTLRYGVGDDIAPLPTTSLASISDKVLAERVLAKDMVGAQDRLNTLCELLGATVWQYDLLSGGLQLRGAVEAIYGAPAKEVAITNPDLLLHYIHPADRARFTEAWAGALAGAAQPEFDVRIRWNEFHTGREVRARMAPEKGASGEVVGITGVFAEATAKPITFARRIA